MSSEQEASESVPQLKSGATRTRLVSLDAFRGATIASMILVGYVGFGKEVYAPLLHSEWNGWTFTDVIFPFFLWIVGVALTLSFARRIERGDDRRKLMLHVLRRSFILIALGLFLNAFPNFHFATLRFSGVLQRIGVCYLFASIIFLRTKLRGQIAWTAGLLIVYSVLMKFVPVPGYGSGVLEVHGNFAQYIDNLILKGHMYRATWDPEGIVSTLPAIATTLFGVLTGHLLRAKITAESRTAWMFVSGNGLLFAGSLLSLWIPINKNLWTSSYALFMAGLASNVFACAYWLVDVKGWQKWLKPFAIYGMNAITVYFLSQLPLRSSTLFKVNRWIFDHFYAGWAAPKNASLLFALSCVLFWFGVSYAMYRKKWFVKI